MKKKLLLTCVTLACVFLCVFGLVSCGKEINYLKADDGSGQLKTDFDFGTFSADDLATVKTKLSGLTFYYEYYPDRSTEKADMSKVKIKHFVNGESIDGLPETLQAGRSYQVCYYYEGHEPTPDFSDSFVVKIDFSVN